jgi:hypothetical protein
MSPDFTTSLGTSKILILLAFKALLGVMRSKQFIDIPLPEGLKE